MKRQLIAALSLVMLSGCEPAPVSQDSMVLVTYTDAYENALNMAIRDAIRNAIGVYMPASAETLPTSA